MRINKNVKSIAVASAHFAKHQYPFATIYDFDKAIVRMDLEKNLFSITYLESSSHDSDDDSLFYQSSDTTYYGMDQSALRSIIRFHVGLVLPKEKSRVVRQIARDVLKTMRNKHAYTQVGWYGHSKDYSQYIMPIDEFIKVVTAAVIPVNQETEVV
jgi:hypothetical protein